MNKRLRAGLWETVSGVAIRLEESSVQHLWRGSNGLLYESSPDPARNGRVLPGGPEHSEDLAHPLEWSSILRANSDPEQGTTPQPVSGPAYATKDSGKREEMPTGSVRDSREGKGRFELISPFALSRLAGVYERGAKKYADRNWEKGQPFSRFLDSAMRHLNRYAMGWSDEDHLAQAAWNICAIMHFQEIGDQVEKLDDMPHYQEGPKE